MDGRGGEARWAEAGQARRIQIALARQRSRRRDFTMHARRLLSGQVEPSKEKISTSSAVDGTTHCGPESPGNVQGAPMEIDTSDSARVNNSDGDSKLFQSRVKLPAKLSNKKSGKLKSSGNRKSNAHNIRQRYSDQLAHHEWMIHIPEFFVRGKGRKNELSSIKAPLAEDNQPGTFEPAATAQNLQEDEDCGWYVAPRPEGRRCLVIASHGATVVRDKNGCTISTFQSILPNGSRTGREKTHAFAGGGSILDCILQEDQVLEIDNQGAAVQNTKRIYWILDVMCWKGYSLYDCSASFRWYWLRTKLSEIEVVGDVLSTNSPRFAPVPRFECNADSLGHAYQAKNFEFRMDGLIFINCASHYEPGPLPTPLTLIWKDESCAAPYFKKHYVDAAQRGCRDEEAICELLEGMNVRSNEPVFLRVVPCARDSTFSRANKTDICVTHGSSVFLPTEEIVGPRSSLVTQGGIVLGHLPKNMYRHNRVVKVAIDGVRFDEDTQMPMLQNPRCLGMASKSKLKAHSLSRIIFHHQRANVPSMKDLMQRASQATELSH